MRRIATVGILLAPGLAWLGIRSWVAANVDQWAVSATELPLTVRLALFTDNWAVRMMPFVIVATVVASPLITWALLRLVDGTNGKHDLVTIRYAGLSLASLVVPAVLASAVDGHAGRMSMQTSIVLVFLCFSASYACYVVSLGASLDWQRERFATGVSSVAPRRALFVALALQYLHILALLVPLAIWARGRRDQARASSAA